MREAHTPEGRARAKEQLLNAIGRAGRPATAARSLAVVVPAQPVRIATSPDVAARSAAPFLGEEDGSTEVASRLGGLIEATLSDTLDLETMGVPEQAAFAFLSFTAESGDASAVLGRSFAAHTAHAAKQADRVADALRALGRRFLDREGAGGWIATAAHRAGISLPAAVALERRLRGILTAGAPVDVRGWARALVRALAAMPAEARPGLLGDENIAGTVRGVASADRETRRVAWRALARTLDGWLTGRPLTDVGAALHGRDEPIGARRARNAEMPRTLRFVRDAIEREMTTVAGATVAIVLTGAESDPEGPWALEGPAASALGRLPVAIRAGAADPAAMALVQAGLRPRVVAHLVARLWPPPEKEGDEVLPYWARHVLGELEKPRLVERYATTPAERAVLAAAVHVRSIG